MKNLIFVMFLTPTLLFAQDSTVLICDSLIETEVDKMTGKSSTKQKNVLYISSPNKKEGIAFWAYKSTPRKTFPTIVFMVTGERCCIDDEAKINILFRNGTRIEMVNNTSFNCKSRFVLYFGGVFGKKKELKLLKTLEIETIRIRKREGYIQEDLTPEQSRIIMKVLSCLQN